MRAATDHLFREGRLLRWGIAATGVLVETLLDHGADGDVAEAEAAITGWRTRQPTTGWLFAKSGCCGSARCWPGARRRRCLPRLRDRYRAMAERLASKATWSGPRR